MATLIYEQEINAPLDKAWATFADFGDFLSWNKLDVAMELSGASGAPGMVRTLVIPGLGRIGERLDKLDHGKHELTYTLVEGNPLGMDTYRAVIYFSKESADRCIIHWRGDFTPMAGQDADTMGEQLKGSYIGMSDSLDKFLQP